MVAIQLFCPSQNEGVDRGGSAPGEICQGQQSSMENGWRRVVECRLRYLLVSTFRKSMLLQVVFVDRAHSVPEGSSEGILRGLLEDTGVDLPLTSK